jgi:hypothetical protein
VCRNEMEPRMGVDQSWMCVVCIALEWRNHDACRVPDSVAYSSPSIVACMYVCVCVSALLDSKLPLKCRSATRQPYGYVT